MMDGVDDGGVWSRNRGPSTGPAWPGHTGPTACRCSPSGHPAPQITELITATLTCATLKKSSSKSFTIQKLSCFTICRTMPVYFLEFVSFSILIVKDFIVK